MKNKSFDLTDKNALITGASGLLGFEHAIALLECKANLVLTDINFDKLIENAKTLKDKFPDANINIFKMDVSSKESILNVNKELRKKEISQKLPNEVFFEILFLYCILKFNVIKIT